MQVIGAFLLFLGFGGIVSGDVGMGLLVIILGIGLINAGSKPKYTYKGSTHHYQKEKSCFTKSTLIFTPKGWKEIGSINFGDSVFSYDPASGQINVRKVQKKIKHSSAAIWKICNLKSSNVVLTTSHHTFLTQRGWVLTKNLKIGDQVLMVDENLNKEFGHISHIEETDRIEPVYNLYTETEHTFIASGLVAHNFTYFRTFRTWWHKNYIDSKEQSLSDLVFEKNTIDVKQI